MGYTLIHIFDNVKFISEKYTDSQKAQVQKYTFWKIIFKTVI